MTPYETPAWFLDTDSDGTTRLRQYFDDVEELDPVNGYDERNTSWFEERILPDFLGAKSRLRLGPTLLDVGCAYGYFTRRFAEHFSYVLGVDFAPLRIAGARERNAEYLELDLTTGWQGNLRRPFDSAVSSAVLQHISPRNRARAFATIRDALTPGARLILYDESSDDRPEKWDGFYEALSPRWIRASLLDSWSLEECSFVAIGLNDERIYRYELARL
jgi:cyclopropane fatty-acyl-phospholipid synthase-like methyltransferase